MTNPSILLVYAAGLLQGLVVVSFPASAAVLKSLHQLSDAQYGAIFLPQVTCAIVGSFVSGSGARRLGVKPLLVTAALTNGVSQLLLAASAAATAPAGFRLVMLATAATGLGFGLNAAPLNTLPSVLFPLRPDAALVAMHTIVAVGLAVGPLMVAPFVSADAWAGFPLTLAGLLVLLALALLPVPLPRAAGAGAATPRASHGPPAQRLGFWLFVLIAVLYALAEGTFSNWAVLFLYEARGVPEPAAGLALTMFWSALVAGRLLTSALVSWVSSQVIWLLLLALMIAAFLLLPLTRGVASGVGLFALAGLACSGVFPLTVALVSRAYPDQVEWVSSMVVAALMLGIGVGSFVVGPLRELLPFDQLYRLSGLYPALALTLALVVVRREGAARARGKAPTAG